MNVPEMIGRYKVKSIIGEGAMGTVYHAFDPNLDRTVAIKTMRTTNIRKAEELTEFRDRFFQESRANGKLNHPNVAAVYDCGVHGEEPFMVMEFIDGIPLDEFMTSHRRELFKYFPTMMKQIASGLDYAHEEGVFHRDIKPGNILVTLLKNEKYRAKIVDFGLAKLKDSKLTQTGTYLGTPSYSSPEQIISGRVTAQSDVYSLGTVAYEIMTGHLPFDAESLHAVMYRIANTPPTIDLNVFTGLLDVTSLARVFQTVLAKDPAARYESASEFVEDLCQYLPAPNSPKAKMVVPIVPVRPKRSSSSTPSTSLGRTPSEPPQTRRDSLMQNKAEEFHKLLMDQDAEGATRLLEEMRKLGKDVAGEEKQLAVLRSQLAEQEAEKKRQKAAKKIRAQFAEAESRGDIEIMRVCMMELEKMAIDVSHERESLARCESLILKKAEQQRAEERAARIAELRSSFAHTIEIGNLAESRQHLIALRELDADVAAENQQLMNLDRQLQEKKNQQQRASMTLKNREAFRQAYENKDVHGCRQYLKVLKDMGLDIQAEQQAVNELEEKLRTAEAALLKERMIRSLRAKFKAAIEAENIEECEYYSRELLQLNPGLEAELKTILDVVAQTRKARLEFKKGLETHDLTLCSRSLDRLKNLGAAAKDESQALSNLKNEMKLQRTNPKVVREAEELKKRMTESFRAKFQESLSQRDIEACRHYLRELKQLTPDTEFESNALLDLETHT